MRLIAIEKDGNGIDEGVLEDCIVRFLGKELTDFGVKRLVWSNEVDNRGLAISQIRYEFIPPNMKLRKGRSRYRGVQL